MSFFIFQYPIQDICYLTYISCKTNRYFSLFNRIEIFLPVSAFYIVYLNNSILLQVKFRYFPHQFFNFI